MHLVLFLNLVVKALMHWLIDRSVTIQGLLTFFENSDRVRIDFWNFFLPLHLRVIRRQILTAVSLLVECLQHRL